ncbi:hypothetical protein JVU11DRAFT_1850 [Chiua virens]|nr:hypothetical protein JVU11DRAFT_1850 [Chiua virens]
MDLSQQELPLTAYFTRNSKEVRPRTVRRKTARPVEVSQSPARSPKRRRTTASSSKSQSVCAAENYQAQRPWQHLPSVELNTTLSSEKGLAQPDSGSVPSKPLQSLRERSEAVSEATLATLSTSRERTTEHTGIVSSPRCRLHNNTEACIITPRTLSRRAPKTIHDIHDQSPLAHSNCPSLPKPSQATPISSCSPVTVDCCDPFHAYEKDNRTLFPREDPFLPLERTLHSVRKTEWTSSQYLLDPDATPKHKRYSQRIDHVASSQTQEEVELTLAMSHNSAAMARSLVGHTPATFTPSRTARVPCASSNKRKSQGYSLPSVPIGSPNSPHSSRCLLENKASDERSSKLSSPLRRDALTPSHSPSYKNQRKTLRSLPRHESIENIPPVHTEEDSLTEPESELDVVQVPPRSLVRKDACTTIRSGFTQGNLSSTEDDSATEAESDTEFHKCLAGIGRKPHVMYHSKVSKERPPPPPVISPLVSPARPRIAPGPPNMDFSQFCAQEGTGLSVPGSYVPFASALEQIQAGAGSLPSIVRDFVRMFPGDESYPADFPESLRA